MSEGLIVKISSLSFLILDKVNLFILNTHVYKIEQGDCLELMKSIPDKSIDMILADLPYGVTGTKWDNTIDLKLLWVQYNRIISEKGAIVLFAMQPFTTDLIISNREMFKYSLVWDKYKAGNFLTAKIKPLQTHEDVLVFSFANTSNGNKNNMNYYPVLENREHVKKYKKCMDSDIYARENTKSIEYETTFRYPKSILKFSNADQSNRVHPTQKPISILSYLIKTYTLENETVLDNTMGSGSTGVACISTNRNFIGYEKDSNYFSIAEKRILEEIDKTSLFNESLGGRQSLLSA